MPLRGVSPEAFQVHNRLKIVEGRNLEFGKNEIIAGRAAAQQFVNLNVGTTLKWGENTWTLVGIFDDGGSVSESELWCDVKVLQPAYRRGNSYQSVYARLGVARLVPAAQGLADVESAAHRHADARAGLLRQPDGGAADDHPHDWRHHRRADGHRRGVRRGHHDVHGGRQPHARDRHAARARIRHVPVVFSVLAEAILLSSSAA